MTTSNDRQWREIIEKVGILVGDRGADGRPDRAVRLRELQALISSAGTGGGTGGLTKVSQLESDVGYVTGSQAAAAAPIHSIQPGTNVTIDDSDPKNPVINASGGGGGGLVVQPRVSVVARTALTYLASGTSMTHTVPAGTAVGDLILATVMARSAIAPPIGWALVGTINASTLEAPTPTIQTTAIYQKVAAGSDLGLTETWSQAVSNRMAINYIVLRAPGGCEAELPSTTAKQDGGSSPSLALPMSIPTKPGSIGVAAFSSVTAATSGVTVHTPSLGWAPQTATGTADSRVMVATKPIDVGPVAESVTITMSYTAAPITLGAVGVVVKPLGVAQPVNPGPEAVFMPPEKSIFTLFNYGSANDGVIEDYPKGVRIAAPGTSANSNQLYYALQALGAMTNFDARVRIQRGSTFFDWVMAGIILRNSAGASRLLGIGSDSTVGVKYNEFSNDTTWRNVTNLTGANYQLDGMGMWLRIRKFGSTYTMWCSSDGFWWQKLFNGALGGFEPSHIGLFLNPNAGGSNLGANPAAVREAVSSSFLSYEVVPA